MLYYFPKCCMNPLLNILNMFQNPTCRWFNCTADIFKFSCNIFLAYNKNEPTLYWTSDLAIVGFCDEITRHQQLWDYFNYPLCEHCAMFLTTWNGRKHTFISYWFCNLLLLLFMADIVFQSKMLPVFKANGWYLLSFFINIDILISEEYFHFNINLPQYRNRSITWVDRFNIEVTWMEELEETDTRHQEIQTLTIGRIDRDITHYVQ